MWKLIGSEIKGVQQSKRWYMNDDGQRALFKPMTAGKIANELAYYSVCLHLGIACTKVETVKLDGIKGIMSYDVGKLRFISNEGEDIKTGDKIKSGITFEELSVNMPEKEKVKFADMVFADTLLMNSDRHSENFKLRITKTGVILGLLDLFDHDQSFMFDDPDDYYFFRWNNGVEWETFERVIKLAYGDFPDRISCLINKAKTLPKDTYKYDGVTARVNWIEDIISTSNIPELA